MIQNLNFYDIYGYLLPGLSFLLLIWLPFGLLDRQLPSEKWSSALVAIALAYIVGHFLQIIAQSTLPSYTKDSSGHRRFPSDLILDADNPTFSEELKRRLAERIRRSFGIEVQVYLRSTELTTAAVEDLAKRRQDAFLLCRSTLVRGKTVFYGEQFEGMYALMRGLTTALTVGVIYHFGWILGGWTDSSQDKFIAVTFSQIFAGIVGLLIMVLVIDQVLGRKKDWLKNKVFSGEKAKERLDRFPLSTLQIKPKSAIATYVLVVAALIFEYNFANYYLNKLVASWSWAAVAFGLSCSVLAAVAIPDAQRFHRLRTPLAWLKILPLLFSLLALGSGLGVHRNPDSNVRGQLVLIAVSEFFLALKFSASYKVFAFEFPKAIYRDFSVLELENSREK